MCQAVASTGVGKAIAALVEHVIPTDSALACLLAFGLGMVAFTAITGNAFTAFPVMMLGRLLPYPCTAEPSSRDTPTAPAGMICERTLRYRCRNDIQATSNRTLSRRVSDKTVSVVKPG